MKLPLSLSPFAQEAETLLKNGAVGHVEFSGATYQVEVFDRAAKSGGAWAFLQLGSKGHLRDSFCTCKESEELSGCSHLAAAYLWIYSGHSTPLHRRFEKSLWNVLCRSYMELLGDNPRLIKESEDGTYSFVDRGDRSLFSCKGKTKSAKDELHQLFYEEKKETEETSLKFSDLSEEELHLWRVGKPPKNLSYELSYWGDLAKWLMRLQEDKAPYTIDFGYDKEGLPNKITIDFQKVTLSFSLSQEQLLTVIPALSTVTAPLQVHRKESDTIAQITYDADRARLHVTSQADKQEGAWQRVSLQEGRQLGSWYYVPGDGFYAMDRNQLLANPVIEGEAICRLLHSHSHVIEGMLKGVQLSEEPRVLNYSCSFDSMWNFHIAAYLFEEGDLEREKSQLFSQCAYIDGRGFFFLEEHPFTSPHTVIASDDVEEFVTENRSWLNIHKGFETHLMSIEAELAYSVNEMGQLLFERQVSIEGEESGECKDFGSWVYLRGQGFFSKSQTATGLAVRAGSLIARKQIPLFIRAHRHELSYVPGFFSSRCPVLSAKVTLEVRGNEEVTVFPRYTFHSDYKDNPPQLFDDVTYVKGEGFYELPALLRLPEEYREPVVLRGKALFRFLKDGLEELMHYVEELDPRLLKVHQSRLVAEKVSFLNEGKKDRYALKLAYATQGGTVPLITLWDAYQKRESFLLTDAGFFDLTDKRYRWVAEIDKRYWNRKSSELQLSAMELMKLDALEPIGTVKKGSGSVALLEELRNPEEIAVPSIYHLKSTLRHYQEQGLMWLWFLYQHGLSGILCDDMGLGKTHQAMALIAAMEAVGALKTRVLVICPTSVVYHWEEKLEKFMPEIKAFTYYGVNRSLNKLEDKHKILLTSYGIWRNDVEELNKEVYDLAIFDEIQVAKNARSRTHRTLLQVQSAMRLGMTGTPIENTLGELKALFDLTLPGYMPSEEQFREQFIKPIERFQDEERRYLLSRYIKPFILRRKKEDVLLDLPEKTEEIAHCDLSSEQLSLYNTVIAAAHRKVLLELENGGGPIPYIHIFAILSNLKQICDHPAVYHKDPDNYDRYESGKWDLFVELLEEARASRQKVVIFSQYLTMLDIFENYFRGNGIEYATIRGATIHRGEQIKKFNSDPNCEVFLGSLQAAGLGVDLTAGSVVIHYDRWWNAARENQATDRVHRIGQQRGVQVFKLVTKNSFEERIDDLILKKGRLLEEVVGVDDHRFIKQFSRDELVELLQYVDRSVL